MVRLIENPICVKITIFKGHHADEVVYYRNKLSVSMIEKWRWYFEYLAALIKVNNPLRKTELTICPQTLLQGEEYIEEKSKTLLKAKRTKLKTLQNKPVQNDLFNYAKQEQDSKIQTVQSEINALEQGEFNYYVPPTYIYFTNRTGDVQYSYQKRVGKATKNVKVQTMCNNNGQENKH